MKGEFTKKGSADSSEAIDSGLGHITIDFWYKRSIDDFIRLSQVIFSELFCIFKWTMVLTAADEPLLYIDPVKVMKVIRFALEKDIPAVAEIYSFAVAADVQTGHQSPPDPAYWKEWLRGHANPDHPAWVMEEDDCVIGWISLSPYRNGREAFRSTVEVSYYLHPDFTGKGLGSLLIEHVEDYAKRQGLLVILAILISENYPSIRLLERHGYNRWGELPEVVQTRSGVFTHLYYGKKI